MLEDFVTVSSVESFSEPIDGYAISPEGSFMDALTTLKGTLIAHKDYGTTLPLLKHRPYSVEWLLDAKRCFKDACAFDPRLKHKETILDESQASIGVIGFEVILDTFKIEGSLNV